MKELLFIVFILLFFKLIREWTAQNKLINAGQQIRLRGNMDVGNTCLSVLFGIMFIIYSFIGIEEHSILKAVNFFLIGLYVIFIGYMNRKSIILDATNPFIINAIEYNFKIQPTDISITLGSFSIAVEQVNNEVIKLSSLDLKQFEIKEIADWIKDKMPNSNQEFKFLNGEKSIE